MTIKTSSKSNTSANHLLEGLNPEQLEAVTQTEGPSLILAGAGTGKTKVITHRLAYLLATKENLHAENILALTYTKKATEEMEQRISALMPDLASIPQVKTFHSFALDLVQEYALQMGLSPRIKLLSQTLERAAFLEPLLWELPLKSFSHISSKESLVIPFLRFIDRCKDELVTPDLFSEFIKNQSATENTEPFKEICEVYKRYEETLKENEVLDFGGLIQASVQLLQNNASVSKKIAEQFQYVLVDEFQDTNISQIQLLYLFSQHHKNLCVVGDDDQAIYRFRGASYASFKKFRDLFKDASVLKLIRNYRSSGNILGVASASITLNGKDRYDEIKELKAELPEGAPVEHHTFTNYDDEALWIAKEIKKRAKKDFSQAAILIRAHSHGVKIKEALESEGVPYSDLNGKKLLEQESVRDLLAFLKFLSEDDEDISLARLLLGGYVNLPPQEYRLFQDWSRKEMKTPFVYLLGKADKCPSITKGSQIKLMAFNEKSSRIKSKIKKLSPSDLLWEVAKEFKVFSAYLKNGTEKAEKTVLYMSQFLAYVKSFEENDKKTPSLRKLLKHLSLAEELSLDPETEESRQETNSVKLLTVHAAKGLEFPIVFMPSLTQGRFPTRKKREFLPFPDTLMKEELPQGDFHIEEERRLFYVGLTRAQTNLILSSVEKPRVKTSVFIQELFNSSAQDKVVVKEHEETKKKTKVSSVQEEGPSFETLFKFIRSLEKSSAENMEKELKDLLEIYFDTKKAGSAFDEEKAKQALRAIAKNPSVQIKVAQPEQENKPEQPLNEKLVLSHSQIESYEWCPLKYKFHYIYRIPERKNPHLAFGNNVHKALEDFYREIEDGKEGKVEKLIELYENSWGSQGFKNQFQEAEYKEKGYSILKNYFEDNQALFNLSSPFIEEGFTIKINDLLEIRGKIDRVQKTPDNKIEVIDYKTGKAKDQKYADASLQLSIYAMALKQMTELEIERLTFYYLEARERVSTQVAPDRIEETRKKIEDTSQKIRIGDFPACSESDQFMKCKMCDYKSICPVWEK